MSNPSNGEPIVFRSLLIERFRGFNDRVEIPLDASAVVVSGANGQGKTSLFDAIQWLVLGRIQRLEDLRFRRSEEHIVNRYAPVGSRARVQATIRDALSGDLVTVTRTGDHSGSVLEVDIDGGLLVGEKAERRLKSALGASTTEEVAFEQYFLTAALLQQDLVRSVLSTYSHAERYEVLSRLLGLSIIDEFIDELAETEKRIGEQVKKAYGELKEAAESMARADQDVKESRARIAAAPVLSDMVKRLREGAESLGLKSLLETAGSDARQDAQTVLRETYQCTQYLQQLDELADAMQAHFGQKPTIDSEALGKDMMDIKGQLDEANARLKDDLATEHQYLEAFHRVQSQADELKQLASLAMPMLADRCPVCDQRIEVDVVENRLRAILAEQPALSEAKKRYEEAKKAAERTVKGISQLQQAYSSASAAMEAATSWRRQTKRLADELQEVSANLDKLGVPDHSPEVDALVNWFPLARNWASDVSARLRALEQLAKKTVAAHLAVEETSRLGRLEADLDRPKALLSQKQSVVQGLEESLDARRRLTKLARHKATEVVREAFDELEPVVQDLFCRLAPHPTFDRLSFTHELYRRRGSSIPLAIDQQTQLEVSPAIGFSSAQANVAALCYFLALAFASSEADFGFVLLDDPLQAMDDVNVLGFSDLCRFLRREKQLIVATHEDRLSNLLVRKLRSRDEPFNTITLNLSSWNRSGPYKQSDTISPRAEISILASLA